MDSPPSRPPQGEFPLGLVFSSEVAGLPITERQVMTKPPLPLIVKWRDLAQEGRFYTDIAKVFPDYSRL